LATGVLLAGCLIARSAAANGAFPGEMGVLLPAATPRTIYVASNFGLLVSKDGGASWFYVCEAVVSPSGGNVLHYALGSDGTLFAAAQYAFTRSTDGGLTWTKATGAIAGQQVYDGFSSQSDPSLFLALGTYGSDGSQTAIYPSRDEGQTFGAPLATTDAFFLTVEVSAKGDAIYATSWDSQKGRSIVYASTDGGQNWTQSDPTNGMALSGQALMIAGVDPADSQTIYFRATLPPQFTAMDDKLAVSTDGGQHVTQLLDLGETMGAFAEAGDGTLYVGGSGTAGGIWSRAPNASSWTSFNGTPITCLGLQGSTLYACSSGIGGTFALGSSTNGGQSFTSLFDFTDIGGPVPCSPVSSGCAESWTILTGTFGTYIGGQAPDAGPYACPSSPTKPTHTSPKGCACSGGGDPAGCAMVLAILWGVSISPRRTRRARRV
jgi:photosystem II stability/assembly factor-like uncharacterized protein